MIEQTSNFTYVIGTLIGLCSAAIMAAIPIVIPAMLKRYTSANNKDLTDKLIAACEAAAGAAYQYASSHTEGLANVQVHNQALAVGLNYVLSRMPDVVQTLGLTPEAVQVMVSARLGSLLASDPTVSAGTPTTGPTIQSSTVTATSAMATKPSITIVPTEKN